MFLHELMLYVDDPKKIGAFWQDTFNFRQVITEEEGILKIMLYPHDSAETAIILFEKAVIAKVSPEVDLATPSMLFAVKQGELDNLYKTVKEKQVVVGELVTTPSGMRVFNFADPEGHYFAVREL